ncbi:hypothetical protein [Novosphingobium sp. TH158]|uniref:hypothetical protein n=1 Tax=Novosphingobium sp. TH158 TaxID=2067455 RepID=UPI000C7C5EBB|nr:hypothetical protein [Novosphingobium sp. TH158]PLK25584.1 hypothetical protein C0V78_00745 [Novosphingobium sp. TH158]
MKRILIPVLVLSLAACSTGKLGEGRVRSALMDAGLDQANASCMAERMSDRLSLGQLKRLEALKTEKRSLYDYVAAVKRLSDSELLQVTSSAAALCMTGFAKEKR